MVVLWKRCGADMLSADEDQTGVAYDTETAAVCCDGYVHDAEPFLCSGRGKPLGLKPRANRLGLMVWGPLSRA